MTEFTRVEVDVARVEFTACLTELIDGQRVRPGDDLISDLLTARDAEGRPMSDRAAAAGTQRLTAFTLSPATRPALLPAVRAASHRPPR
ncbi:hypothetical protein [Streptomyces sp. NPDC050535]|uniref:hypothetical protein n=1 Tax=Streptomyces sp. NPDC050535 TaxID=3365626 RepID=UPI0037953D72